MWIKAREKCADNDAGEVVAWYSMMQACAKIHPQIFKKGWEAIVQQQSTIPISSLLCLLECISWGDFIILDLLCE
jgi:hypothetical protein